MSKAREFSFIVAVMFILIMVANFSTILELKRVNRTDTMIQLQSQNKEVKTKIVHSILFGHSKILQEKHGAMEEKDQVSSEICLDILEIGKMSHNAKDVYEETIPFMRRKKAKKGFLRNEFYHYLGNRVASMVNYTEAGKGINGTNVTIANEWRFRQMGGQLPYLSCPLHEFQSEDLEECIRARAHQGRTTHLAFFGDSRIRHLVELFLIEYQDLDLSVKTYKGQIISAEDFMGERGQTDWIKYKHRFLVTSNKIQDLQFEFVWAPVLQMNRSQDQKAVAGARDLLEEWTKIDKKLPDLIVLNTGTWGLTISKKEPLDTLIYEGVDTMITLGPLLAQLASRTTVIFQLPDPIKEFIRHQFTKTANEQQTNTMLSWLQTAYANLQPPKVIVWDSFLPVAYQMHDDCIRLISDLQELNTLPAYASFSWKMTWNCYDRMHNGFEGSTIGLQMLINHICNPFIDRPNVCCSRQNLSKEQKQSR